MQREENHAILAIDRREIFEQAAAAFLPAPDDSAAAIPFYRAWAGLRAAWGESFCKDFNGAVHNAACAAGWAPDGERYQAALITLRHLSENQQAPAAPREVWANAYHATPVEPTERDAREFFNAEWRRKYPGKRANSKEANTKYAELSGKALAILRERYAQALAEYQRREEQTSRENAARREEWFGKLHGMAAFEDAVRDIYGEE